MFTALNSILCKSWKMEFGFDSYSNCIKRRCLFVCLFLEFWVNRWSGAIMTLIFYPNQRKAVKIVFLSFPGNTICRGIVLWQPYHAVDGWLESSRVVAVACQLLSSSFSGHKEVPKRGPPSVTSICSNKA